MLIAPNGTLTHSQTGAKRSTQTHCRTRGRCALNNRPRGGDTPIDGARTWMPLPLEPTRSCRADPQLKRTVPEVAVRAARHRRSTARPQHASLPDRARFPAASRHDRSRQAPSHRSGRRRRLDVSHARRSHRLARLARRRRQREAVTSLIVEGGGQLAAAFLRAQLVDQVHIYLAPRILGEGIAAIADLRIERIADSLTLKDVHTRTLGCDPLHSRGGIPVFTGIVEEVGLRAPNRPRRNSSACR